MKPFLETTIGFLKGVGPERAKLFQNELNIRTYGDLLLHYPFRYIDRTRFHKIGEIASDDTDIQLRGKITSVQLAGSSHKQRLVAQFTDGTGVLELIWFKGIRWIRPMLNQGVEYVIFGRPGQFKGRWNMAHPELEKAQDRDKGVAGALQAVYHTSEKAKAKGLDSRGISRAMANLMKDVVGHIPELLGIEFRQKYGLIGRGTAMMEIHFPKNETRLNKALFRLKFDEFFFIQLQLIKLKLLNRHRFKGAVFAKVGPLVNRFYRECLPFEFTNAQKRVVKEIRHDLGSGRQMNRLLQGDVGSGKTIVALMAMLLAIDNGFQAALMAPTEILAEQHFNTFTDLLKDLGLHIALLTGSTKAAHRRVLHESLLNGETDMLIGTHALIEDAVQFKDLGLVIVDEQHRFGVQQRAKLWLKGGRTADQVPHMLIMTATPIPRTLAMTVYGDLDTSVIDEMPPGRKPVKTLHRFDSARLKVFGFMHQEIKKGRQIYVVYPLIDESEKLDYKHLTDGYESMVREFPLPDYQVSILHGRMKSDAKEYEMQRFKEGKTHIMVSTTVIEVGVDVPNASVMIIESAERFGLSQLHQLRGRVGRGADQSYCILMTGYALGQEARTRMETMVATNDGFEIAEVDMRLRGPGDMQGTLQSGQQVFQLASLSKDGPILDLARNAAIDLLTDDPGLDKRENALTRDYWIKEMKDRPNWGRVS